MFGKFNGTFPPQHSLLESLLWNYWHHVDRLYNNSGGRNDNQISEGTRNSRIQMDRPIVYKQGVLATQMNNSQSQSKTTVCFAAFWELCFLLKAITQHHSKTVGQVVAMQYRESNHINKDLLPPMGTTKYAVWDWQHVQSLLLDLQCIR
jgi:hypothetical protein